MGNEKTPPTREGKTSITGEPSGTFATFQDPRNPPKTHLSRLLLGNNEWTNHALDGTGENCRIPPSHFWLGPDNASLLELQGESLARECSQLQQPESEVSSRPCCNARYQHLGIEVNFCVWVGDFISVKNKALRLKCERQKNPEFQQEWIRVCMIFAKGLRVSPQFVQINC